MLNYAATKHYYTPEQNILLLVTFAIIENLFIHLLLQECSTILMVRKSKTSRENL